MSIDEQDFVRSILEQTKKITAKDIVELSHDEKTWLETKQNERIPYEYSKQLKHFV